MPLSTSAQPQRLADSLGPRATRRRALISLTPLIDKADGRAEAVRVVAIMELLREAGVKRLKLLTLPEGGG